MWMSLPSELNKLLVLRTERGAVSIARILFTSVLSPRYSVLMSVFTSIFIIRFFKVSFSIKPAIFQASGYPAFFQASTPPPSAAAL